MNKDERKKLPRIYASNPYTTGDSQEWTYEYTWEDFEEARKILTPTPGSELHALIRTIKNSFIECPEKLLDGGICKEVGYTPEQIKDMLLHKCGSPYF